jgi:hypothetical protein
MIILLLASLFQTDPSVTIGKLLDDWHAAAARADEEAYFKPMAADAVYLGTDATERWTKEEFRKFAHPYFAKGKAWSFKSVRRAISLSKDGKVAWFDEDLATPNLGPCRGSGVLVLEHATWKITQYNLAATIPNDKFPAVKKLLEGK